MNFWIYPNAYGVLDLCCFIFEVILLYMSGSCGEYKLTNMARQDNLDLGIYSQNV